MKSLLAGLATLIILAGCTQPASDAGFDARAAAAPALLLADQGASGTLVRADSFATVSSTYRMEGQPDMEIEMAMSIHQEYFQGGSFLMNLSYDRFNMGGDDQSQRMAGVGMSLFCSPEHLVVRSSGLAALGAEELDLEIPNPRATCDPPVEGEETVPAELMAQVPPEARDMVASLAQQAAPKPMTYLRADGDDGWAVYEQDMDFGDQGLAADFELSVRGRLDGPRLVRAEMSGDGTMTMSGAQSFTVDMQLTSLTSYEYGARGSPPAGFA